MDRATRAASVSTRALKRIETQERSGRVLPRRFDLPAASSMSMRPRVVSQYPYNLPRSLSAVLLPPATISFQVIRFPAAGRGPTDDPADRPHRYARTFSTLTLRGLSDT